MELKILQLNKKLAIFKDSKDEIQNRLDIENQKLSNIQQKIRDIRKYGEINAFDFHDIPQDIKIDLNKFLNIAAKNVVVYENDQIFDVITDASRDNYPFILKGYIKINDGELSQINRFDKIVEQRAQSIEEIVDKYDESLEILFPGETNKYTTVFSKLKRSNYGTGCNVFVKIS